MKKAVYESQLILKDIPKEGIIIIFLLPLQIYSIVIQTMYGKIVLRNNKRTTEN